MGKPTFTIRACSDEGGHFIVIPAEIAFDDIDMELEITRCGDVMTIRPAAAERPATQTAQSSNEEPG